MIKTGVRLPQGSSGRGSIVTNPVVIAPWRCWDTDIPVVEFSTVIQEILRICRHVVRNRVLSLGSDGLVREPLVSPILRCWLNRQTSSVNQDKSNYLHFPRESERSIKLFEYSILRCHNSIKIRNKSNYRHFPSGDNTSSQIHLRLANPCRMAN